MAERVEEATRQWLFQVDQSLSPEGFQLLKVLYLNTLSFRTLSDHIGKPSELHAALSDDWEVQQHHHGELVLESARMYPDDSLSLFVHRLRALVPPASTALRDRKSLGAQGCLDRLPPNFSSSSSSLSVAVSQESKMLECLVKTYVTLTTRQRVTLMRNLGESIGKNAANLTVYQLFGDFFVAYKASTQEAVAVFAGALQHVRSPSACVELEEFLTACNLPHEAIQIPDVGEFEADEEVEIEVGPLLKKQENKREQKTRRFARKVTKVGLCHCVPVLLGLILFAVGMGVISTRVPPAKGTKMIETSSHNQMHCPAPRQGQTRKPIRVGRFNTFWHESVAAEQHADNSYYYPLTADVYLFPENRLHVYTKEYTCKCSVVNCEYVVMQYFYLLEGSTVDFLLFVNSTSFFEYGFVNLTICDNRTDYEQSSCPLQYSVKVKPNEFGKLLSATFEAPKDGYYYITTFGPYSQNALVNSYHIHIKLKFLNESDWTGMKAAAHFSGYNSAGISRPLFDGGGLRSMFNATSYVIVATVSDLSPAFGEMSIIQHNRNLVYVVPAIAAAAFMFLGVTMVACISICCCSTKWIIHRQQRKGNELLSPIND